MQIIILLKEPRNWKFLIEKLNWFKAKKETEMCDFWEELESEERRKKCVRKKIRTYFSTILNTSLR